MIMREDSQSIDEAAADWASRVDGGKFAPEDQALLDAWLAGDSRRLGAFARARAVIQQLKSAKALGSDLSHGPVLDRKAGKARIQAASRRRFLQWGGGAVAAALGAGAITYTATMQGQAFTSRRGEVRIVPLTDGSSVTLNTSSRIKVAFDGGQRVIRLLDGEVLFNVVDDSARPFVVRIGQTRVSAAMGQFLISAIADQPVKVIVQAGLINVHSGFDNKPPMRLTSNRAVDIAAMGMQVHELAPADITRVLSWREGMLSFADMPLDQAVAQFARYSDPQIILEDPALKQETVTGLFSAADPQGFVQAIMPLLNVRSRKAADGLHLSRS